jgi:phosphoribosylaminoimidazole carboxylase PurE protein
MTTNNPEVGVIMGSVSDLEVMKAAPLILKEFGVPHEVGIKSAHRTPDRMREYARTVSDRGVKVVIAGAGGSAHLPGMVAAYTRLPVIGVPVETTNPNRDSSVKSMIDMPYGEPVAVVGVNKADQAALLAIRILALNNPKLAEKLENFHDEQAAEVTAQDEELERNGLSVFLRDRRLTDDTKNFG